MTSTQRDGAISMAIYRASETFHQGCRMRAAEEWVATTLTPEQVQAAVNSGCHEPAVAQYLVDHGVDLATLNDLFPDAPQSVGYMAAEGNLDLRKIVEKASAKC